MPSMTEQVKRAYKKMKLAGFKRGEFHAKVDHVYKGMYNGKPHYEYGDVIISIFNREKTLQRVQALIDAGLYVELYIFADGRIASPRVSNEHRYHNKLGKLWVRDARKQDKYGFDIVEPATNEILQRLENGDY